MRVLLDQNVPRGLRRHLVDHEVSTARHLGWHELKNGELIAAAERASFDVLVTCDQSIGYQQNLAGRRLAIVVLSTNDSDRVLSSAKSILAAVEEARVATFAEVVIDRS